MHRTERSRRLYQAAYNASGCQVPPYHFPDAASLAALRAWYAGVGSREALERYCPHVLEDGRSARGVIGGMRRLLVEFALYRHRDDLAQPFRCAAGERSRHRKAASRALDTLRTLVIPQPQVSDMVDVWLPARVVTVLHRRGIQTLADLTVRIPRRQRWWRAIPGLGERSARRIEALFAAHPALTERARALIVVATPEPVVPWENIRVPHDVDGSRGVFRAPKSMCALEADNDYQAISAWLDRHEAAETQRAYRREAERLLLWVIVERGKSTVFTNERGCDRLSRLPASSGAPHPVGRAGAAAIVARVAAVHGRAVAEFDRLRAVGAQCDVPMAH